MSEIINLNVALLPSKEISQKAINLSKQVAEEFETFFVLNSENCIPHISLYHAAYSVKHIPKIKEIIANIAKEIVSFPVELTTVFWEKEGWISFQANKSEQLINLHKAVVEKLNSLREGNIMESDKRDFSSYPLKEQESLKSYGYRHSMELFRPHLTIARLKSGDVNLAAKKLEGNDLSFSVDVIGLCQLGDYGTCINILGKWDIK